MQVLFLVLVFGLLEIMNYQGIKQSLLGCGFQVFLLWEILLTMSNLIIFAVGLAVTLVAGMGVITSQVFAGYKKPKYSYEETDVYVAPANRSV